MQLLHVITSIEARFHGFGSTTSSHAQQMPVQVLDVLASHIRYIRVFQLRNRTVTASQTASGIPGLRRISAQTVRNHLREHGIRARLPYFGAVLNRHHRRARVRLCNTVRILDLANWRRVWFSDESRFMLERQDGRVGVNRGRNERFAPNCIVEVDNWGEGSVMGGEPYLMPGKHS